MNYDVTSPDLIAADILRHLPSPSVRSVIRLVLETRSAEDRVTLARGITEDAELLNAQREVDSIPHILDSFDGIVQQTDDPSELALLAAAYLTESGERSFRSRDVNGLLADRGKGIRNITQAIGPLLNGSPPLIETAGPLKEGKRAQQDYQLTAVGSMEAKQRASQLSIGLQNESNVGNDR